MSAMVLIDVSLRVYQVCSRKPLRCIEPAMCFKLFERNQSALISNADQKKSPRQSSPHVDCCGKFQFINHSMLIGIGFKSNENAFLVISRIVLQLGGMMLESIIENNFESKSFSRFMKFFIESYFERLLVIKKSISNMKRKACTGDKTTGGACKMRFMKYWKEIDRMFRVFSSTLVVIKK